MLLSEIIKKFEKSFPTSLAYDWDNVGLLCGRPDKEIKNVLITLDVTGAVIEEAKSADVDLIVSHHPLFLTPPDRLTPECYEGELMLELAECGIALYSAHTNLDVAKGGINSRLAEMFGIKKPTAIEELSDGCGLGRMGQLSKECSFSQLCEKTKELLGCEGIRVIGELDKKISVLAVAGGACDDLIMLAEDKGADAIITSDLKYHRSIEYSRRGICVIDAGHYYTERCAIEIFEEVLSPLKLRLFKSENTDIFKFV